MKTIGLIGGMSWESSAEYYRMINRHSKALHGGHHNAKSVLVTVDFAEIESLQRTHDWAALGERMADAARQLEAAGADLVVLTTNTMHRVHDAIEAAVMLPFLHIADPTGSALRAAGVERVALLGTRYTMELPFYAARLREKFGLDVLVPDEPGRDDVHRIIYDELCHGVISAQSRATYVSIIDALATRGAQTVILGCTEITLLIGADDSPLPVFDTTALHAKAAVEWAAR
ncbi:aspartate/glutamate racemase family protein [Burkholderia cenocepacia]|uniref:aspartate/glutamate racemase family protein n=1 Tax=Burkholderia cenocepacia TaxID=95486 RepID=UPI00078C7D0F|nr:aspartate/glutamate racemase family protein [Burkholderia cenocepacia]AMU06508.1 aspartate racemase [Burkholderia cenocepacia]AMU17502.1 aspartate racemase [Burkholderia cenocepacia]MCW3583003.1 aspartate/glutamate racemase family protein [Burkholderia cenocepacia]MCW3628599.1 aspartate/glutamate racemase family protein [Burkholderia cenocepacia]MCW3643572.1 aspartate/glutamate racemase family protein [Burkholderia cenocepacia]